MNKLSQAGWAAWMQARSHEQEEAIGLLNQGEECKEEDAHTLNAAIERRGGLKGLLLLPRSPNLSIFKPAWLRPKTQRKVHPTSWLDGLRGVAAFFVLFHHSSQVWLTQIRPGWGSNTTANYLISLPFIRVVFSGTSMVSLFFVISGYVLSTKSFKLARQGRQTELLESLAGSTFRRGPRLYIPCIISTFITANLAMMGFFVPENVGRHYPHYSTWMEQMSWWVHDMFAFISPFGTGTNFELNLWTFPIEFKGSLTVFLCVLGLARCRNAMRTASLCSFCAYWLWFGAWDSVLFTGGMIIADCHYYWFPLSGIEGTLTPPTKVRVGKVVHLTLIMASWFLLSMPDVDEGVTTTPGFVKLATTWTPRSWQAGWGPGRWWICISSVLLVGTIDHAGPTSIYQKIFTSRFAQYLGDISFSLYLCHGMTIYILGIRVVRFFTGILGEETSLQYGLSLLLSAAVVLPLLFWFSDIFTIIVDRGSVDVARKLMRL